MKTREDYFNQRENKGFLTAEKVSENDQRERFPLAVRVADIIQLYGLDRVRTKLHGKKRLIWDSAWWATTAQKQYWIEELWPSQFWYRVLCNIVPSRQAITRISFRFGNCSNENLSDYVCELVLEGMKMRLLVSAMSKTNCSTLEWNTDNKWLLSRAHLCEVSRQHDGSYVVPWLLVWGLTHTYIHTSVEAELQHKDQKPVRLKTTGFKRSTKGGEHTIVPAIHYLLSALFWPLLLPITTRSSAG